MHELLISIRGLIVNFLLCTQKRIRCVSSSTYQSIVVFAFFIFLYRKKLVRNSVLYFEKKIVYHLEHYKMTVFNFLDMMWLEAVKKKIVCAHQSNPNSQEENQTKGRIQFKCVWFEVACAFLKHKDESISINKCWVIQLSFRWFGCAEIDNHLQQHVSTCYQ